MRNFKTIRVALLGGVAALALSGQANALEAQAFVDRLAAVLEHGGYEVSFGEATLSGDTITVDGLTIGVTGMEASEVDTEIVFSGVVENADGSYTAQSATVPYVDMVFSEDDVEGRMTLVDIAAEGLRLPPEGDVTALDLMLLARTFSTGAMSVLREGEEVISIDAMDATTTFTPAQDASVTEMSWTAAIDGIWADLSTVREEEPEAGATIEALGLVNISGDMTHSGSWTMADGRLVIDETRFDFADIGALDITFDIGGLTPSLLDQLYAMQAQMAPEGEMTDEQMQAQAMQSMALMQGVSIGGLSIRYDDASLAGNLLDFFAEQAGSDRAAYVDGLKAMAEAMVAQAGIAPLTELVVPQVNAFLDDPQSFEVRVAPAQPTPVLMLMAAAANPAGLISALGLTVTANQ
jgi:hypothetical protein